MLVVGQRNELVGQRNELVGVSRCLNLDHQSKAMTSHEFLQHMHCFGCDLFSL